MENHAAGAYPSDADAEQKPRRVNRRRPAYLLSEEDEFLLTKMPAHYVEILRQEGSIEDISRRLQLPQGTVKSRTHRARAALDQLRAKSRTLTPQ